MNATGVSILCAVVMKSPQCKVSQMGSTGGGDNLGKMVKNCMKMTKPTFLGQNSGEGGQASFLGSGGPPPPVPQSPPPTRGNPVNVYKHHCKTKIRF